MQHFINSCFCNMASLSWHASPTWITGCLTGNLKYLQRTDRDSSRLRIVKSILPHVPYSAVSWPPFDLSIGHLKCSEDYVPLQGVSSIRDNVEEFTHQTHTPTVFLPNNLRG